MRVLVDTVRLHFSTKYSQVWKGWKERRKCSKTVCSDFLTRLTCLTLDTILWKAWLFWSEHFSRSRVKFSHRTLHWSLLGDQSEWVFTASEWKQGHKTCYGFKNVPKVVHPGYPSLQGISVHKFAMDTLSWCGFCRWYFWRHPVTLTMYIHICWNWELIASWILVSHSLTWFSSGVDCAWNCSWSYMVW